MSQSDSGFFDGASILSSDVLRMGMREAGAPS